MQIDLDKSYRCATAFNGFGLADGPVRKRNKRSIPGPKSRIVGNPEIGRKRFMGRGANLYFSHVELDAPSACGVCSCSLDEIRRAMRIIAGRNRVIAEAVG